MGEWWSSLTRISQLFFSAAAFFSVFFVWQLIATIIGLGGDDVHAGDSDIDAGGHGDVDGTYDNFEHGAQADATETIVSFKLLSIRSIITFFTLFTWGGGLYLSRGLPTARAMAYSTAWGLAGMLIIAALVYMMQKLTHTGTKNLNTCVGGAGSVYLNIPAKGVGEVRVLVSGQISYVKARGVDGAALAAGTPVKVVRRLDDTTVEVKESTGNKEGRNGD